MILLFITPIIRFTHQLSCCASNIQKSISTIPPNNQVILCKHLYNNTCKHMDTFGASSTPSTPIPTSNNTNANKRACVECKKQKRRCIGEPPCVSCVARGKECVIAQAERRGPKKRKFIVISAQDNNTTTTTIDNNTTPQHNDNNSIATINNNGNHALITQAQAQAQALMSQSRMHIYFQHYINYFISHTTKNTY